MKVLCAFAFLLLLGFVVSKRFNPHVDLRRNVALEASFKEYENKLIAQGVDPLKALPPYQWFTQRVDHFDQSNQQTWQQRYLINDQYWNGEGPVFLIINGEGPMSQYTVTPALISVQWAQTLGALVVTLEHRYYGESNPTTDLSTSNLHWLQSEQALADLAAFREFIASEYDVADAQWVAFGGSYAGCLTAWYRIKYPQLVDAVVASSGPVNAEVDFYQYLDVVTHSLSTTGSLCVAQIANATQQIQQLLQNVLGQSQLEKMFNLCGPLTDQNDIANFMMSLAGNFMGVVQYNLEDPELPSIDDLCSIMNNTETDVLTNYINVWNMFAGNSCVDVSYELMIEELQNTSLSAAVGGRQWFYQTCTEFGFYQTSDSSSQPFGDLFPAEFSTQQCTDVFGFEFLPNVNWTIDNYGGREPAGSNILFVNGDIDPWHSLGVIEAPDAAQPALLIQGTAHCADMGAPNSVSPATLEPAQAEIFNQLLQFLHM